MSRRLDSKASLHAVLTILTLLLFANSLVDLSAELCELVSIRATYSMARQCVHTILSFPWKATQVQMSLSVCSFVFVFKLEFSQVNKSTWDKLVDQSLGWIFVKTFLTSTQTLVKWIDDELLSVCLFQCSMWRNRVQFASSVPDTFYNQVCRSNGEFLEILP